MCAMPVPRTRSAAFLIVEAARCWRAVRDACAPVQPALFARLQPFGLGILAPVFDSLLALFEARSGRRFRTSEAGTSALSEDEEQLVALLSNDAPEADGAAAFAPMDVALRSTRIMLALADEADPGAYDRPIFFTTTEPAAMRPAIVPMRAPITDA
ncbi:hypothetical protein [Sphingomonas sp. DT-204]|uniref:hypothetical protein n=1 Tax=Sphingomonas sp. DT-204 TaxID=3396166 RepID=UPI003F1AB790